MIKNTLEESVHRIFWVQSLDFGTKSNTCAHTHTLLVCVRFSCLVLQREPQRARKDAGRLSLVILVVVECTSVSSHEARTTRTNKRNKFILVRKFLTTLI